MKTAADKAVIKLPVHYSQSLRAIIDDDGTVIAEVSPLFAHAIATALNGQEDGRALRWRVEWEAGPTWEHNGRVCLSRDDAESLAVWLRRGDSRNVIVRGLGRLDVLILVAEKALAYVTDNGNDDCWCVPAGRDEDGNAHPKQTCIACELRSAIAAARGKG